MTRNNSWPNRRFREGAATRALHNPATGISYLRSRVKMIDITDGTSNTYLLGEKYLTPDNYLNGVDPADNENDVRRIRQRQPPHDVLQRLESGLCEADADQAGWSDMYRFAVLTGSGQHALCDGSVRVINYSIDPETHRRLGNRKDGRPIDAKKF